jgi:hypothetical protein
MCSNSARRDAVWRHSFPSHCFILAAARITFTTWGKGKGKRKRKGKGKGKGKVPVKKELNTITPTSVYYTQLNPSFCVCWYCYMVGQDSSFDIAQRYGPDGPRIEVWRGEIFRTSGVHQASCTTGTWSLSQGKSGQGVAFTTYHNLEPRLKKEYRCTSTAPLGLHGLF